MSDIIGVRGDTEYYDLTLVDADGNRIDLTGLDMWFTVKAKKSDRDSLALIQKTVGNGITLADQMSEATKGQATVHVLPSDTNRILAPFDYYYDVQLKSGDVITTVIEGVISFEADVTSKG